MANAHIGEGDNTVWATDETVFEAATSKNEGLTPKSTDIIEGIEGNEDGNDHDEEKRVKIQEGNEIATRSITETEEQKPKGNHHVEKPVDNSHSLSLKSVTPVTISFEDITLDVRIAEEKGILHSIRSLWPKKTSEGRKCRPCTPEEGNNYTMKRILHLNGINDKVCPGDLVALMGSSGAGKSTLLNVLSRRVTNNTGKVLCNGLPDMSFLKDRSAFIQQEDIFYGNLTVQEHLRYQAELRLPRSMKASRRAEEVDNMISRMGLIKARNNLIGNIMQGHAAGISGGERKRLAVATELLTAPSVIFADEPTTGLDSFMAMSVVDILKELADNGRTVICTIHQPSSSIFERFSKLLLLCEGYLIYYGDPLGAIKWFAQFGRVCPQYCNPADFYITCISFLHEERESRMQEIAMWAEKWKQSGNSFMVSWKKTGSVSFTESSLWLRAEAIELAGASKVPLTAPSSSRLNKSRSRIPEGEAGDLEIQMALKGSHEEEDEMRMERISWMRQSWAIYKKDVLTARRTPSLTYVRLLQTVVMSLVPSFMFYQLKWSAQDAYSKVAAGFFVVLNQCLLTLLTVAIALPTDRPIFQREYESGVISMAPYMIGRMMAEFAFHIFFPLLFNTICFWIMNLANSVRKWILSSLLVVLICQATLSIGYLLSCSFEDADVVLVCQQIVTVVLVIFSGFLIRMSDLANFWLWLVYLSPFKYGLSSYATIIFENEVVEVQIPGAAFLEANFDVHKDDMGLNIGALFALCVVFRLLAMLALDLSVRFSKQNQ